MDISLAEMRSNLENLEEAFRIAQQELGIPRLLEPEGGYNFLTIYACIMLSSLLKLFIDQQTVSRGVLTHFSAE